MIDEGFKPKYLFPLLKGAGQDPEKIRDLVKEFYDFYDHALEQLAPFFQMRDTIRNIETHLPNILFVYRTIHVDASRSRHYLEKMAADRENAMFNWCLYSDEARDMYGTLKVTEAGKIAKADSLVVEWRDLTEWLRNQEERLESAVSSLGQMGYVLRDIITIHTEGLTETMVNR